MEIMTSNPTANHFNLEVKMRSQFSNVTVRGVNKYKITSANLLLNYSLCITRNNGDRLGIKLYTKNQRRIISLSLPKWHQKTFYLSFHPAVC